MKYIISVLTLLVSGFAMASTPIETLVPTKHVFVPLGFDSNDNTEVIVEGYLPNLCYKSPQAQAKVVGRTIQVKMTALYHKGATPTCPSVVLPFVQAVSVGLLDQGKYKVEVNKGTPYELVDDINIDEPMTPYIDNNIYADVSFIERDWSSRKVTLKGYNPSECFEPMLNEEGKPVVEFYDNGKDTYSVLPKLKKVGSFCPLKMTEFEIEAEIPDTLARGEVLLHVRVMSGKSYNIIYSNLLGDD